MGPNIALTPTMQYSAQVICPIKRGERSGGRRGRRPPDLTNDGVRDIHYAPFPFPTPPAAKRARRPLAMHGRDHLGTYLLRGGAWPALRPVAWGDRKSTRLNSSHRCI